jgi:hypothetical protein
MEGLECEGLHNDGRSKEGSVRGGGRDLNGITLRCDVGVNVYAVRRFTLKKTPCEEPQYFQ